MMHPVPQFEITERKFGVIYMRIQRVEFRFVNLVMLPDFAVETFERLEEMPLMGVVEGLAKMQIVQLAAAARTRCQAGEQQEPDQ